MYRTNFYANGKLVWTKESPYILNDSEIEETIKRISNHGYEDVDAITDTSGRMIEFDRNGAFLKEVEE